MEMAAGTLPKMKHLRHVTQCDNARLKSGTLQLIASDPTECFLSQSPSGLDVCAEKSASNHPRQFADLVHHLGTTGNEYYSWLNDHL